MSEAVDMASLGVLQSMESLACERDRQEFAFGDTLDIKTGLILASLTFLAIQSGTLINASLCQFQKEMQYASMIALILGGVCSVVELYPREYDREATPAKYQAWIKSMEAYKHEYPDAEPLTEEAFAAARVSSALESIKTNQEINAVKSRFMFAAFAFTVLAFILNVATLAMRLF